MIRSPKSNVQSPKSVRSPKSDVRGRWNMVKGSRLKEVIMWITLPLQMVALVILSVAILFAAVTAFSVRLFWEVTEGFVSADKGDRNGT